MYIRMLPPALLLSVLMATAVVAQEKEETPQTATTDTAASPEKKESFHRLPPYFRDVATDVQIEKIYTIQEGYGPQIDALKKQLAALTKKRDADVKAVLTTQQHTLIEKLASDARAKRKAYAAAFQDAIKKAKAEAAAKVKAAGAAN